MKSFKFYKDDRGRWFIDLPEWTGDNAELQMVCGADTMLNIIAQGEDSCRLTISDRDFVLDATDPLQVNAFRLIKIKNTPDVGGALYKMSQWYGTTFDLEVWLCHVTEFVFGCMPEIIYIA